MRSARILVVGGASLDTLAGSDDFVAGGAGMYTAMAAHRSGADVSLCAPRPAPMPEPLQPVADCVDWRGPQIDVSELAHFKISYADGQACYETSIFGAEASLTADDLPDDLSQFDYVHLIPLGNIEHQVEIAIACKQRGAHRVSMGTALHLIEQHPAAARKALEIADTFFMNSDEATRLFGSVEKTTGRADQLLFVTLGANGAVVVQGSAATATNGSLANVVDPTGAGDTFCGATLVALARGEHPVMAVHEAMPLAARVTEQISAGALLGVDSMAIASRDSESRKAAPNDEMIGRIAQLVGSDSNVAAFNFVGPDLPPVEHPAALDFFFAATLQQFGFWTSRNSVYEHPLIAVIDGEQRKGAFYFFRAFLRWLQHDPDMLSPSRQATLTRNELLRVLRADDGTDPTPALDMHLHAARQYGADMLALKLTPDAILKKAAASPKPVSYLLQTLDQIGGYKEDPLRKKSALLAVILQQRPEGLLPAEESVPPIVDYHIMRSCLRTGLVDIHDSALRRKVAARQMLNAEDEWDIRTAAYTAIHEVARQSGKSMGAVDWFFFQARSRCPEMSEPLCSQCAIDDVCAHRKELFQPVRRTSFY